MRTVEARGRWIWALSGLVTLAALAVPGAHLITSSGQNENAEPQAVATRTVTVRQPVTSVTVQSYGAPVQVRAEPVSRVQITETIMYDLQAGNLSAVPQKASASPLSAPPAGKQQGPGVPGDAPPAVLQSVSGGRLSLTAPACDCSVSFALTVPPDVSATVATEGGQVTVSGIAGANLDSGGGPVSAANISGPLTVNTYGGSLQLDGLAGPLSADTANGNVTAEGVASATANITTGGGDAVLAFSAAPDAVTVSTDSGAARLTLPGGPYALTADSGGEPESEQIATDPAAHRSLTVITNGGPLELTSS
jgi:hypothetical protein